MTTEVFHARGCAQIGSFGDYTVRFDPARGAVLPCCDRVIDGRYDDDEPRGISMDNPLRVERTREWMHVEHPEYAEADREAEQDRLDGWAASIMAVGDARTRAAVADALSNHMVKYGRVP